MNLLALLDFQLMNLSDKISNPLEVEFYEKENKIMGNYNFNEINKKLKSVKE